jgi:pyruvate,water dikinase
MEGHGVFWFQEIQKEASNLVGKKCANLGEMTRIGMPVPKGFAIAANVQERFMKETGAIQEIQQMLKSVGELRTMELRAEVSESIRRIIEKKEIPSDTRNTFISYYEELCRERGQEVAVSVRSAGVKSHPGQYETFLNVRGVEELLEKVKRVWSSIFNQRTISSLIEKGLTVVDSPCIGVGVVEMVKAKCAGVCFTIHPVTGDPSVGIIEANWGLGESVVSGKVNVDSYILDKENLKVIEKNLAEKKMLVALSDLGIREEEVPPEKQNSFVLSDEDAAEILGLGKVLESHFGEPQDIEWAIQDEAPIPRKVFILQARPVVGVKIQKKKSVDERLVDEILNKVFHL